MLRPPCAWGASGHAHPVPQATPPTGPPVPGTPPADNAARARLGPRGGRTGRGLNFGLGFVVGLRLGKEGVGGGLALVHLPLRRVQIHHHAFVGATYIHADIVDGDPDAVLVRWELVIVGGQQAV